MTKQLQPDLYAGFEPRQCPDCVAEGNEALQPPQNFYLVKSSRYKGGRRLSAYCKRHQKQRNVAARAERLARSPEAREKKRAADARYAQRHREQRAVIMARYRRRNAEKIAAYYARWVEQNPAKRRESQDAWRERQKLRHSQQQQALRLLADKRLSPEVRKVMAELAERDRDLADDA